MDSLMASLELSTRRPEQADLYKSTLGRAGNRNILTSLEHLLLIFQFSLVGLSGLGITDRTSSHFLPNKSATGSKASKPFRDGQ